MSTLFLGPHFLQNKTLYANSAGSTGGSTGFIVMPGFISNEMTGGYTAAYWNGGVIGSANPRNSAFDSNAIYPTIQHFTTTIASGFNKFLAGGPAGSTRLIIFKGTKPDISTVSNLSDYSSNQLISFSIPAYDGTNPAASGMRFLTTTTPTARAELNSSTSFDGFSMILGVSPSYVAATASGVATWFWFGNYSSPTNLADIAFTIGSVGSLGSGADLEIYNTTVTSGDYYRSAGFKFSIPSIYTV
jgi:hypothetical protein